MQAELWPHSAHPSAIVDQVAVALERLGATRMRLRYLVRGRIDSLVLPAPAAPLRTDGLWRTTCFEAFLAQGGGTAYRELNFSPSSQWAAYDLAVYRDPHPVDAPLPAPPDIEMTHDTSRLELAVTLSLDIPQEPYRLGLSAVIEERGGSKSFWAVSHPSGVPDFHDPACFALELPPAPRP